MAAIERLFVDGQAMPFSHYCHVVKAGNQVWVSGTVGMDREGTIPETTVAQFDLALRNLDACLRAAGAGPEHVVKVTVFLTNVMDRELINVARMRYFGVHRPASTLVEVSELVHPDLKVEIEAQAIVA